jgi:pyridoxamine 5'-phosphate oxidase
MEPPTPRALRRIPALAGDLPTFDPGSAPEHPTDLFLGWFAEALDGGVPEPHSVTVATAAADGTPSARVVVLSAVGRGTWSFATDLRSRKAQDLAANPRVALSWYWQPHGRQVRVTGRAEPATAAACAEDFLSRSPASRGAALATDPGQPLGDPGTLRDAVAKATARVEDEPGLVLEDWLVLEVTAEEVEFWQGDPRRTHLRRVYRRSGDGWTRGLVWP